MSHEDDIGPTGDYPLGQKISADDKGGLRVAMYTDINNGIIFMDFGTNVKWFGMDLETAQNLAAVLQEKIDQLKLSKN